MDGWMDGWILSSPLYNHLNAPSVVADASMAAVVEDMVVFVAFILFYSRKEVGIVGIVVAVVLLAGRWQWNQY
jgi:hypothetical protein